MTTLTLPLTAALAVVLFGLLAAAVSAATIANCRPTNPDRLIFYRSDIFGELPFNSTQVGYIKMMKGEHADDRTLNYSTPDWDPKASYLVTGWDYPDSDTTKISTIGFSIRPQVVGPTVDYLNRVVYYISIACRDANTAFPSDPTTLKMKVGKNGQQEPNTGFGNALASCGASNHMYVLHRYHYDTGLHDMIYEGTEASFPANNQFNQEYWQLAIDSENQKLYYTIYDPRLSGVGAGFHVYTDIYQLDLSGIADGANMKKPVKFYNVNQTEQGPLQTLQIDCDGNIFFQDFSKVHRIDTATLAHTYPVPKDRVRGNVTCLRGDLLCTVTGMGIDPVNQIIYYAYNYKTNHYSIRRVGFDGTNDNVMYTGLFYEFYELTQTVLNMDVDVQNQMLYMMSYGSNVKGRSLQRLKITAANAEPRAACLWGYKIDCYFRKNGEEHIIGYAPAADAAYKVGTGHASNFANGEVLTWDSGNQPFAVIAPATSATRKCDSNGQVNRTEKTVNYQCNPIDTPKDEVRRIFAAHDPGLASDRTYWLVEHRGWNQIRLAGSAVFLNGTYKQRLYWNEGEEDYNNVLWLDNSGLDQNYNDRRRGVTIAGPTYSNKYRSLYYMKCTKGWFTDTCMEFGIYALNVDTLQKVEIMREHKQLMPGPNQYTWNSVVLAVDEQKDLLYWMVTPYNGFGYNAVNREMLFSIDFSGTLPLGECAAQLEVEFPEWPGSIRSLQVDTCNGDVYGHEVGNIWRWRRGEHNWTQFANIGIFEGVGEAIGGQSRMFGGMTLDDKNQYVYVTFLRGFKGSGDRGVARCRKDDTSLGRNCFVFYNQTNYELSFRGERTQYLRAITLDLVNELVYVQSYYGNSAKKSILQLPIPEHANYSGVFACLYGHPSIGHSLGLGNRDCVYQGPEPRPGNYTGYDVAIPYDGLTLMGQSPQLVVLPGPVGRFENPAVDNIPTGVEELTAAPGSSGITLGTSTPRPPVTPLPPGATAPPAPATPAPTAATWPSEPSSSASSGATGSIATGETAIADCCASVTCVTPRPTFSLNMGSRQGRHIYFESTAPEIISAKATEPGTNVRVRVMTETEWGNLRGGTAFQYFSAISSLTFSQCFHASGSISSSENIRIVVDWDEEDRDPKYEIYIGSGSATTAAMFALLLAIVMVLL